MSVYLRYYLDMKKKQIPGEKLPTLEEVKNNYVQYLLDMTDNNLKKTAEILDVPPVSLQKKTKD
jgi:transcriptional regulator with PAS, ATPase and Fis domain